MTVAPINDISGAESDCLGHPGWTIYPDAPGPLGDWGPSPVDWERRFDHMQQHSGRWVGWVTSLAGAVAGSECRRWLEVWFSRMKLRRDIFRIRILARCAKRYKHKWEDFLKSSVVKMPPFWEIVQSQSRRLSHMLDDAHKRHLLAHHLIHAGEAREADVEQAWAPHRSSPCPVATRHATQSNKTKRVPKKKL